MSPAISDAIVRTSLNLYSSLKFRPANPLQYTILSTFTLVREADPDPLIAPISLGSGAKCLPESCLSPTGDMIHDSHAEVLARRGFVRWLLEETCRIDSPWIEVRSDRKWGLKRGVSLHLYISTLPCGDASMRTLAAAPQDPTMAALKALGKLPVPVGNAARGRDNYSLLGVLRTKPGRADSPPTLSMSCSDKIARWSLLGVQGALASNLFDPIYIDQVIVGGVPLEEEVDVREDCERAFWRRLDSDHVKNLPPPYALQSPRISFTRLMFPHGRAQLDSGSPPVSCNESLCWISESCHRYEVLIHGLRRGVGEKQRLKPHLRPLVSKIALFSRYQKTLCHLGLPPLAPNTTYHDAKLLASSYQTVKARLIGGSQAPFTGWIATGGKWDNFTL